MALVATLASQPFSINWTCSDDTSLTLTASSMMNLGVAVGAHIDALHQRTRTAKDAIQAATTVADVNAVVW